jgi:glucosamine--fructose-6-phosphate aminotransferase (isomerizing)
MTPYEHGIHRQPAAMRNLLEAGLPAGLHEVLAGVSERYDRVVMTGMGSGPWALYPAYLRMVEAGIQVTLIETAELIAYAPALLRQDSLLWVTSHSGESAEIVALLDCLPVSAPDLLATTANEDSPLAAAAKFVVPLHAGAADDRVAGTGTFVTTVIAASLIVDAILGEDETAGLAVAPDAIADYLQHWPAEVSNAAQLPLASSRVMIIGRGQSIAAARTGALLIKEAGKVHAEALLASEFRHGPIELADERLLLVVLGGDARTLELTRRIAQDAVDLGARVIWVGTENGPGLNLRVPALRSAARPIGELLALQMLSVAAGYANGLEPGMFRNARRVTRTL